jgi:hypothetical protein
VSVVDRRVLPGSFLSVASGLHNGLELANKRTVLGDLKGLLTVDVAHLCVGTWT